VKAVGPERFGIVAVDCAKDRSKWLCCDFYGKVLVEPTVVEHRCDDFKSMAKVIEQTRKEHNLKDLVASVEMTGTYHLPIYRQLRASGHDTRIVHPFASSHYRLVEHGDIKTDDNDLAGVFRATVNGFGLVKKPWNENYRQMQVLVRHRRDLVNKRSKLQCQVRHHLERTLPGFASLFPDDDLWANPVALGVLRFIVERGATHQAILNTSLPELVAWLRKETYRFQERTLDRVFRWAKQAVAGDEMTPSITRVWQELLDDWQSKKKQICQVEIDSASLLAQTPYILLLSHPGINVVSAAELAGETGPIEHYASPKAISGRAGLFPSRYQSDGTDRGGNLSRFRNARMRSAWLMVAANMIKCNSYYRGMAAAWKVQGVDARDVRCRIANRLTRPIFHMIFGKRLYFHPSRLERGYVLHKLMTFHREHGTPPPIIVSDLQHATAQISEKEHAQEAKPLKEFLERSKRSRRREPKQLGDLMVAVLARLGIQDLESQTLEVPNADSGSDAQ
jgi:transposase